MIYNEIVMNGIGVKDKIYISKKEYFRLKKLEERFGFFWEYFQGLLDIKEAREEIKKGKVVSQEKLFKKLGI